jgi:hypothetical protein
MYSSQLTRGDNEEEGEVEETEQQERTGVRFRATSQPATSLGTGAWATTQRTPFVPATPERTLPTPAYSSNSVTDLDKNHSSSVASSGRTLVTQGSEATDRSSSECAVERVTRELTLRKVTEPLEQPARNSMGLSGDRSAGVGQGALRPVGGVAMPQSAFPVMAAALPMSLMTPLPRIPPFSGDGQEEGFVEWHEHFYNVAKLAGWDDHWRLAHLTASLKDTAASFYRSCSCDVRNDYQALLTELKRRFTPVELTFSHTATGRERICGAVRPKTFVNSSTEPMAEPHERAHKRRKWAKLSWPTSLWLAFART